MDFGILGPLEVRHEGRAVEVGRPKQRALLAVLLLRAGRTVSVERLAGDLWEVPPNDLTGSLQAHVSRLRSALGAAAAGGASIVVTDPPGYRVDLRGHDLDLHRFEVLARAGRDALEAGRPEEALERIADALGLWRGEPLSELWLGPLARAETARLETLALAADEDRVDALLALGRHRDALDRLEAMIAAHPLRERLWSQRITALYRAGRQAEALRAYGDVRRLLAEELGIAPGPELQALEAAVLDQRPDLAGPPPAAPPPPAEVHVPPPGPSTAPPAGNLPVPLTTFVGRVEERADVAELLVRHRLVSLVGFGGAGKTRLALEVAADLQPSLPGGSWMVDLSAAVDGAAVARAMAAVLGVPDDPFRPLVDRMADALRSASLLVVLDNCEHLVRACADLAGTLLGRCPGLRILATTREPLGLPGEVHVRVGPLGIPDEGAGAEAVARAEAVQLFVERARLVRRDFAITPANATAVCSVCRRLDGIPLAIELAAARLAVLSPQQIDQRLGDQFRLLADEGPGRPERHRTLAATIAWSDALLDAAERELLRRLSVFAGGFGLDAAEAVGAGGLVKRGALLDHLARLVAKSLVAADTGGDEARYRILESIRQHGAERLAEAGETPGVQARHARWFLDLAERAEPDLGGPAQEAWFGRLALDHDNLRVALAWAVAARDAEVAQRLAGALVLFWRVRGHVAEAREWLERALSTPGEVAPTVRARALWGAGFMATMAADHQSAVPALEECIRLWQELGDTRWVGRSLLVLGNSRRFTDGPLVALLLLGEAVTLARQSGDAWCLGHALSLAGSVHLEEGQVGEAEAVLTEALELSSATRDAQSRRLALWGMGQLQSAQGALDVAADLLADGLALARRLREPHSVTSFAVALADVHRLRGEYALAASLVEEALSAAPAAGPVARIEASCGAGALALATGDAGAAQRRFADALAAARDAGSTSIGALLGLAASAHAVGDTRGAGRFAGEALELSEAVGNRRGRAGALEVMGQVAAREGRLGEAWERLGRSLSLHRQAGDVPGMIRAVGVLGCLAAGTSAAGEAVVLLAAAQAARDARALAVPPAERRAEDIAAETARRSLPAERSAAAEARGSSLDLDAAVDLALGLAAAPPPAS